MQSNQRIILIILIALLVLTGAGLFVTTEWGSRTVSQTSSKSSASKSPVDLQQFRNAQALSQLAATPQEQDLARDVLRKADHEVDFAFAAALYIAAAQPVPSTPEIKAILERISKGDQEDAELNAEVARLTKVVAGAKEGQKEAFTQQLDLAKSRQELIEDEIADAHEDLEPGGRRSAKPNSAHGGRLQRLGAEQRRAIGLEHRRTAGEFGAPGFQFVPSRARARLVRAAIDWRAA